MVRRDMFKLLNILKIALFSCFCYTYLDQIIMKWLENAGYRVPE